MAMVIPRDLGSRIVEKVRSGIVFILGSKSVDLATLRLGRKYLGVHSELVVGGGVSVFSDVITNIAPESLRPVVRDIADAGGDYGIYKEYQYLVDKIPVCWAKDNNTIVCKNLDTLDITVKIDGNPVTLGSGAVTGTAEDMTIALPSPLSAGEHDLVVVGRAKAFSGKIWV